MTDGFVIVFKSLAIPNYAYLLSWISMIFVRKVTQILLLVALLAIPSVSNVHAVNGVPHLPQNYNLSAKEWWDSHPYNPDTKANNFIPVGSITNSGPEVDVCSQSGSNAKDKIKNAINKLPSSGGTLKFRKACSPYNLGTALEWIESGYPQDFFWVNGGVNLEITNRSNLHFVADEPGTIIQGSMHIQNTHSGCGDTPSRNFYFKNITFKEPGNKNIAIIFENTEDVLFENVTFQRAGITSVIKGNNIFFRDSYFNNGAIQFDGSQFSGLVNSKVDLDFETSSRMYSYKYFVDFHQNNDGSCDADGNGKYDVYEERIPRFLAFDGNQFIQKNGSAPVILGAFRDAIFQSNSIQGPITEFVKIIADSRPNPYTNKYYSYYDYVLLNNTISNSGIFFNINLSNNDKGQSFARGDVRVAYNQGTNLTTLIKGDAGSNLIKCQNTVNGNQEGGTCPANLDPQNVPSPITVPSPSTQASPLPGIDQVLTQFSVSSSNSYQWKTLNNNSLMYTDRSHIFTTIPTEYQGAYYLQSSNADKGFSSSSNLISFKALQDLKVYVAYTDENSTISSWLGGWTKNQPEMPTSLTGHEDPRLVAVKTFSAGETVTLKGNGGTANETSNYNVLVKPTTGVEPQCQLLGDLNSDGIVDGSDYAALANKFLTTGTSPADLNNDNIVDGTDYALLANNFLVICANPQSTPTTSPSPSPSPTATVEPGGGTADWNQLGSQKEITSGITPSVAVDSQGALHMVYMDNNAIYYRKGDSNGNFGSPETIPTPEGPGDYNSPQIQVDNQNNPHVVFEKGWTSGSKKGWYTNRIGGSWKQPIVAVSHDNRINYPRLLLRDGNAYVTGMTGTGIIAKIENLSSSPQVTKTVNTALWVAYPAIDASGKLHVSGRNGASGHFIETYDLNLNKLETTKISLGLPSKSGEPTGGYADSQGGMHVAGVSVSDTGTEYLWYNSLNRAKANTNVLMYPVCDCHVSEYFYPMIVEDSRGRIFMTYTDRNSAQGKVTILSNNSIQSPAVFASSVTQRLRWNPQIVAAPGGGVYAVWDKDNKVYFRSIGVGN